MLQKQLLNCFVLGLRNCPTFDVADRHVGVQRKQELCQIDVVSPNGFHQNRSAIPRKQFDVASESDQNRDRIGTVGHLQWRAPKKLVIHKSRTQRNALVPFSLVNRRVFEAKKFNQLQIAIFASVVQRGSSAKMANSRKQPRE